MFAVLALAAAACSGGDGRPPEPTAAPPIERPASTALLTIVSPQTGEVVDGSIVHVVVELEGATIVEQTSTDIRPDEGHLHMLLDGELLSMTAGLEQDIPDVEPGDHLLQIEFVAADHAPFDPRVVTVASFQVAA